MAQLCAVTGNIADLGLEPVPNSTAVLRPVREGTSVVVGGDVVTLARKPVDISDDGAVAFDAVTAAYFLDVATPTSFTSIRLGVPDAASAVLAAIANTTPPPPLDAAQIALQGAQEARDEAVEAAGEVAEAFEGLDDAITAIGGIENLSSAVTSAANSATVAEQARLAAQTAAGEAQVAKITWRGDWTTSTAYVARDAVARNGTSYVVKQDHTSGATSDPGSGANWTDFWDVLALKGDQGDPGPAGAGSGDVLGPASATNNHIALFDGTTGKLLKGAGVGIDAFGDVVGPASSTNNHVAVFDGAGGKLLKGAGVAIADLATAAQGAKADTALQPGAEIPWADVTGKPTFFDGTWASLSGKPATFQMGNTDWPVGIDGDYPAATPPGVYTNMRMDAIYFTEMMCKAYARMAATGDPNGAYDYEGFDLFTGNPPADGGDISQPWPRYDLAQAGHHIVLGKYIGTLQNLNGGNPTLDSQRDAKLTFAAHMGDPYLDYLELLEPAA